MAKKKPASNRSAIPRLFDPQDTMKRIKPSQESTPQTEKEATDIFAGISEEEAAIANEAYEFPLDDLVAYLFKENQSPEMIDRSTIWQLPTKILQNVSRK